MDLGLFDHLSSYRLVADGSTIYFADSITLWTSCDKRATWSSTSSLLEPRDHVQVDPGVRGGEPVIAGTRIPYDEVAALLRDGVADEDIGEFFPQVSLDAARDAYDFASYVDSYVQSPERAA